MKIADNYLEREIRRISAGGRAVRAVVGFTILGLSCLSGAFCQSRLDEIRKKSQSDAGQVAEFERYIDSFCIMGALAGAYSMVNYSFFNRRRLLDENGG